MKSPQGLENLALLLLSRGQTDLKNVSPTLILGEEYSWVWMISLPCCPGPTQGSSAPRGQLGMEKVVFSVPESSWSYL